MPLSRTLPGTWRLVSRKTVSLTGGPVDPPALGEDPLGLLIYDRSGNFSAQFMKRDRSGPQVDSAPTGANNSRTIGGYDAYFGRYTVDDESGTVTQVLEGSLSPENVGQVVTRQLQVEGDRLTVAVESTSSYGTPIRLTLVWDRVG